MPIISEKLADRNDPVYSEGISLRPMSGFRPSANAGPSLKASGQDGATQAESSPSQTSPSLMQSVTDALEAFLENPQAYLASSGRNAQGTEPPPSSASTTAPLPDSRPSTQGSPESEVQDRGESASGAAQS